MNFSRTARLEKALKRADSYQEWRAIAEQIDRLQKADRWRSSDSSAQYDFTRIGERLNLLRKLRKKGDNVGLLFSLNEGIHGNLGGMGKEALYRRSLLGTKDLIEDYVAEINSALLHLASTDVDDISFDEKLDFFRRAHHCFGSSAMVMSGSGTLLYFHVGVVKALTEQGILPNIVSGASGGSLVSALVSTLTDAELSALLSSDALLFEEKIERTIFDYISPFPFKVIKVEEFENILKRILPDLTFQEAFEKTGRHLNVSIAAAQQHQRSRLLNAITSPNVYIREAILASAAVPGVYPAVTLAAKDKRGRRKPYVSEHKWVDGSVSDDLPAKRLSRLYGVNHFIVSQTNPHVIPFVTDHTGQRSKVTMMRNAGWKTARAWLNASAHLLKTPMSWVPPVERASNLMLSLINQDYVGDINILPPYKFYDLRKILSHLTPREINDLVKAGERATWPKMDQIRIQTQISRTLDKILHDYEGSNTQHMRKKKRRAS